MPWPVIVVSLALAVVFVGLTAWTEWEPGFALLVVVGTTISVVLVLLGILMIMAGREARPTLWRVFWTTVQDDWRQITRLFWPR